jgi:hypothetical protein
MDEAKTTDAIKTPALEQIKSLWATLDRAGRQALLDWILRQCATCGRPGATNGHWCDACCDEAGLGAETETFTLDDLRARYADPCNWRRNEQGFPYIELFGRVIAIYPWTDGWTWMIYRGGSEPLAWLVDPGRLYADGVSANENAARDEAWKAFQADLEKLEGPIPDDWF